MMTCNNNRRWLVGSLMVTILTPFKNKSETQESLDRSHCKIEINYSLTNNHTTRDRFQRFEVESGKERINNLKCGRKWNNPRILEKITIMKMR
jgi:hypothetical protein